jgi:hypothetical protein
MKGVIIFLTHPVLIATSFCFIIISGEAMGGFYLLYLLFGLMHGGLHSIIGFAGIILLLISTSLSDMKLRILLRIAGLCCMITSLIRFFTQPGGSYNFDTFYQTTPLISLGIFCILSLIFLFANISTLIRHRA